MSDAKPALPGIVAPPPVLYLGTLLLAAALHWLAPIEIAARGDGLWAPGGLLLLLGAALARWAFLTMRRVHTSGSPHEPATALAMAGPFRFSRNPIYVAMTAMYLGLALLGNSIWPLPLLAPLLALMHWGVVLREERYLLARFGDAYLAYKAQVGRWL